MVRVRQGLYELVSDLLVFGAAVPDFGKYRTVVLFSMPVGLKMVRSGCQESNLKHRVYCRKRFAFELNTVVHQHVSRYSVCYDSRYGENFCHVSSGCGPRRYGSCQL